MKNGSTDPGTGHGMKASSLSEVAYPLYEVTQLFSDPWKKRGPLFGAWTILVGPPKKELEKEKELEPLKN